MVITNYSKSTLIASDCSVAGSFFTRFLGLMGKSELAEGKALLISPCNSIHMFFMKIPLDIIFLDANNKVVHLVKNIRPWRATKVILKAACVIELPVGIIDKSNTELGDIIKLN